MLSDVIYEYIKSKGIKQIFIAEKLGISNHAVSDIMSGKRRISAEEYYLLCKVLEIPMTYFFDKLAEVKS